MPACTVPDQNADNLSISLPDTIEPQLITITWKLDGVPLDQNARTILLAIDPAKSGTLHFRAFDAQDKPLCEVAIVRSGLEIDLQTIPDPFATPPPPPPPPPTESPAPKPAKKKQAKKTAKRSDLSDSAEAAAANIVPEDLVKVAVPAVSTVEKVYYITERAPVPDKRRFSGDRDQTGKTHYGAMIVIVPPDPKRSWFAKIDFLKISSPAAPPKHLQETPIDYATDAAMYADIKRQFEVSHAPNQSLIYVHGFNDGFNEEIWRVAKLASDVGFSGAPMLYDWPSWNETLRYSADRYSMEVSVQAFADFLANFGTRTGDSQLNFIAHSMGCWGLLTTLDLLRHEGRLPVINQIMLAAPDIGKERFEQIVPGLLASGKIKHITVYASSHDWAMKVSQDVSKLTLPPVGGLPPAEIVTGVDTIDTSNVSPDLLDHDYFVASPEVVHDIGLVLQQTAAPRPGLQAVGGGSYYWTVLKMP
jgi:esterase/lipase superfamily enzyme